MRHGSLLPAVVLTTLALFLTSCSRNPVAPSVDASAKGGVGNTAVSVDPSDAPPSDGGTPLTRVQTLTASEEGLLVVGRWTLYIRKNSLKMPATITMHVVDPEAMEVDFDVQPAAANNFSQTVFLTANLSDVSTFDYNAGGLTSWDGANWTKDTFTTNKKQQNVVGRFSTLSNTQVSFNASGK